MTAGRAGERPLPAAGDTGGVLTDLARTWTVGGGATASCSRGRGDGGGGGGGGCCCSGGDDSDGGGGGGGFGGG